MSDQLKRFTARFDSECANCDRAMYEGDLIARTPDGDYICEDCFDQYTD